MCMCMGVSSSISFKLLHLVSSSTQAAAVLNPHFTPLVSAILLSHLWKYQHNMVKFPVSLFPCAHLYGPESVFASTSGSLLLPASVICHVRLCPRSLLLCCLPQAPFALSASSYLLNLPALLHQPQVHPSAKLQVSGAINSPPKILQRFAINPLKNLLTLSWCALCTLDPKLNFENSDVFIQTQILYNEKLSCFNRICGSWLHCNNTKHAGITKTCQMKDMEISGGDTQENLGRWLKYN